VKDTDDFGPRRIRRAQTVDADAGVVSVWDAAKNRRPLMVALANGREEKCSKLKRVASQARHLLT